MQIQEYKGRSGEYLQLVNFEKAMDCKANSLDFKYLTILWSSGKSRIKINDIVFDLDMDQMVFLTEFHKVETIEINSVKIVQFNRDFFCIADNDSQVGCKGILFYGASQVPVARIPEEEIDTFETLWKMFLMEIKTPDNLQLEMLRSILKRLLIICTRLYSGQTGINSVNKGHLDIIREFNFLVQKNFRTKHRVADYAEMMNKSTKTISNMFSKISDKPASEFIRDRIALESRQLLAHSSLNVNEIAFQLGFEDVQSFSRFFKGKEGISPKEYRNSVSGNYDKLSGKTA
jgi:AraC family transcriptional activator of pobA